MSDFEEAVNLLRAAPDSGVRVSRLRVLRVECVHNRRLAEVYRVQAHRILVVHATTWVNPNAHLAAWDATEQTEPVTWPTSGSKPVRQSLPMFLNVDSGDDLYEVHVASSCCTRTVTLGWIRECLASSARRVVLPSNGTVE